MASSSLSQITRLSCKKAAMLVSVFLLISLMSPINSLANHNNYLQQNGFLLTQNAGPQVHSNGQSTGVESTVQQQHQQQQQQQQQQPQQTQSSQSNQIDKQQAKSNLQQTNSPPPPGPLMQQYARESHPVFRFEAAPGLNSSTVKLVWSVRSNAHVDRFDILWGPMPDGFNLYEVSKLDGSVRDYTLTQLQPNTTYQFQLNSYSGQILHKPLYAVKFLQANQPESQQINAEIMPKGLRALAKSNNSIQLSWIEPERPTNLPNSIRVNIIRYYITHNAQIGKSDQPQYYYLNATQPPEPRIIVQKLKPATEYAFAVKTAYYSPEMRKLFTQSGFSMDTTARTFDLDPTAPRNFTIEPLPLNETHGKLELRWSPPESPNGHLKGYLILYSHEADAPEEQWERIEVSSGNHWLLSGLKYDSIYYLKVRAQNQRGFSPDSEVRRYSSPAPLVTGSATSGPPASSGGSATGKQPTNVDTSFQFPGSMMNVPIPQNNILLLLVICGFVIFSVLSMLLLLCTSPSRRRAKRGRKSSNTSDNSQQQQRDRLGSQPASSLDGDSTSGLQRTIPISANGKPNFATAANHSSLSARVSTLARRRDNSSGLNTNGKSDFWISAMGEQREHQLDSFGGGEKSQVDPSLAMVSIQQDAPQFATTQLAGNLSSLPEYQRFVSASSVDQQHQQAQYQQHSHYHQGHQFGAPNFDQVDAMGASALMTLSKRQQQQLYKYQQHFATPPVGNQSRSSPNQQPPPPPPLNIEQQQQQLQMQQSIYGTHHGNASTRSLKMHRPTLYDPVSGSFIQAANENGHLQGPPNYNSSAAVTNGHFHASTLMAGQQQSFGSVGNSNTLQFYPHQSSTLLSRRSTNTLRSFQNSATNGQQAVIYGQLGGVNNQPVSNGNYLGSFAQQPNSFLGINHNSVSQQPQKLLQSHQAVINQLNLSSSNALPLKHVSAVRPQIMSSLEDRIELELAEKEQQGAVGQQPQRQQEQQQPELVDSISLPSQDQAK